MGLCASSPEDPSGSPTIGEIKLTSAGMGAGTLAAISVAGKLLPNAPNSRGLNCVAYRLSGATWLDDSTALISARSFDTYEDERNVQAFVDWVRRLEDGTLVLVAAKDSVSCDPDNCSRNQEKARDVMQTKGMRALGSIGQCRKYFTMRQGFCLCGFKGRWGSMLKYGRKSGWSGSACSLTCTPSDIASMRFHPKDLAGLIALLSVAEHPPYNIPQQVCNGIALCVTIRCALGFSWFI